MFKVVRESLHWWFTVVVNSVPLTVRLWRCFYKKLLEINLTISDVAELDAEMAEDLEQIRAYRDGGGDVTDLELTFAISQDEFGQDVDITLE
jgi:hypothetical protein